MKPLQEQVPWLKEEILRLKRKVSYLNQQLKKEKAST